MVRLSGIFCWNCYFCKTNGAVNEQISIVGGCQTKRKEEKVLRRWRLGGAWIQDKEFVCQRPKWTCEALFAIYECPFFLVCLCAFANFSESLPLCRFYRRRPGKCKSPSPRSSFLSAVLTGFWPVVILPSLLRCGRNLESLCDEDWDNGFPKQNRRF